LRIDKGTDLTSPRDTVSTAVIAAAHSIMTWRSVPTASDKSIRAPTDQFSVI
jgi:hypothetical protein